MGKITPYQQVGTDGRTVLEFGPRYSRVPQDDTTLLSVFHRTTNGGVSFLLERDDFAVLAEWFRGSEPEIEFSDLTHRATVRRYESGYGVVTVAWHSASGDSRSVALSAGDMRSVAAWLDKADRQGWEGWKSGQRRVNV